MAADPEVGAAEIALSPRSSCSRKLLQNQVQKLTLELEEQKGQAQLVRGRWDQGVGCGRGAEGAGRGWPWPAGSAEGPALPEQEKAHLEERLLQTRNTLRQLEAELQALQKSCLLQLARSSWVGRMLRSSTGSVEVSLASGHPRPPSPPSSVFPRQLACPLETGASAAGPWAAWEACPPQAASGTRTEAWGRDELQAL